MKVATWTPDTKTLYWKQKMNELDAIETQKALAEEKFEQGKLKGEIKGEISKVKDFMEFGATQDKIISKLKFLTNEKINHNLDENLKYIQDHLDDSDSDICGELGLLGALSEAI